MANRQVGKKVIQWSQIAARLPAFNAPEVNLIQEKYTNVKAGLARVPEQPPAVDWEKYNNLITYPNYVKDLRKQYESLKFTYPEDSSSATIAADEKAAIARSKEVAKAAEQKIAELEQQLAALKAEKPLDQVTVDEVLATKPEWKRRFQDEIEAGKWD
ncbi:hypothetical protein PTSG_03703 [Salpingoeca rosetta]|uniref:ATP synthase subunit d, mitochondrial n=1 Tax=Salpingoeca rosetta (strain ATCC 50818 / BSB-021) TaxID=946362 RepID=F2U6C4_SALR5|nr:uncharacterized protein PTSG_03703 [Salpingoeca rosetta]EGD83065.1 hypothetical protein PTSG_03703 [Salpingoeca rosetta]|eukprot:XP_004995429.1 hypothetical protein PTSG_03703 [Salpingoeca rosetta]